MSVVHGMSAFNQAGGCWNSPHVVRNCCGMISYVWPHQSSDRLCMKTSRPQQCSGPSSSPGFFAGPNHHPVCERDGFFIAVGRILNGLCFLTRGIQEWVSFQQLALCIYIPLVQKVTAHCLLFCISCILYGSYDIRQCKSAREEL